MNRDTELATMLSDFAHTLVTDFPIQGILDELVHRIVGLLEVSSAGVTLISPGRVPHYVAASDLSARRYEELQTELDEGPCLEAYRAGRPVAIADLAAEQRYPRFAPAALDAGLRAVFTFPLCHQDRRIGALDLYRDAPGQLDPWALKTAQTLAQVTTVYLLNAQACPTGRCCRSAWSTLRREAGAVEPMSRSCSWISTASSGSTTTTAIRPVTFC